MTTSCNEPCAPKKKCPRLGVRFQMELDFSSNDEKDSFLTRLEKVKHYFSSRSSRSLDNRELLQCLLDLVNDEEDFEPAESSRDDHVKSILNCSGKVVFCIIYLLLAHKIGVFTGSTNDSQSMFICERSTFHELSAGLTKPCDCRAVAWVLSRSVQVQLSNFDFLYNSSILI